MIFHSVRLHLVSDFRTKKYGVCVVSNQGQFMSVSTGIQYSRHDFPQGHRVGGTEVEREFMASCSFLKKMVLTDVYIPLKFLTPSVAISGNEHFRKNSF